MLRPALGVGLLFATNGAALASVLPWYPTLKAQWGLGDFAFGLMVAAVALGSLVSTVLPSLAVNRFGPRPVVFWGTVVLALLIAAVGWAPSAVMLAGLLAAVGLLDAVIDVSQNVAGVRVEAASGRSILSSMHACWRRPSSPPSPSACGSPGRSRAGSPRRRARASISGSGWDASCGSPCRSPSWRPPAR